MIELLVVIAIIAILAGMLLPALAKAKAKAQGIMCMSNMKQLSLAWMSYALESNDRIPYASGSGTGDPKTEPHVWMTGSIDFNSRNSSNWDVERDIKKSPLWPYCASAAGILKCPADRSTIVPAVGPLKGQRVHRVRSISMMIWHGGFGGRLDVPNVPGVSSPPWRLYLSLNDMIDPGPSHTLLFWDQREDSINLGNFFIDMSGFPDRPNLTQFDGDLPASYHNRAGGLTFVDGHAQIKRWMDARTTPPMRKNSNWLLTAITVCPNNPDVVWLQERATRRK